MPIHLCLQRRICHLITSLVIGVTILVAEPPIAKSSPTANTTNLINRPNPNIDAVNRATRLTDEVADSL
jgi:hypothetical protein